MLTSFEIAMDSYITRVTCKEEKKCKPSPCLASFELIPVPLSPFPHWTDSIPLLFNGGRGRGEQIPSPFTWRGMGSARLYFAQDSPCDDNIQPYHTGSVAAWINKDCAFHWTPGRRCQMCYWCIIEDSRKRQHHHRHLEHKDTKSRRETSGHDTRNGQVQMEHPWTLWNEMEELWRNNNRGRTQGFLQWKRG